MTSHDRRLLLKPYGEVVVLGLWLQAISFYTGLIGTMEYLRESMAISWTVVIVPPSSGTLTFRRLDSEPLRCQNGTLSGGMAVSLREVGERPIDSADSLSEDKLGDKLGLVGPTGLFDDGNGNSWYLEAPDCN